MGAAVTHRLCVVPFSFARLDFVISTLPPSSSSLPSHLRVCFCFPFVQHNAPGELLLLLLKTVYLQDRFHTLYKTVCTTFATPLLLVDKPSPSPSRLFHLKYQDINDFGAGRLYEIPLSFGGHDDNTTRAVFEGIHARGLVVWRSGCFRAWRRSCPPHQPHQTVVHNNCNLGRHTL